ncbi:auxin response factor 2 [Oryza brachyantha]|uniref:auxin response factor 2 n=1 Tax=Oryza brachyantha TaxID=4533 RepID=UPI001ADA4627|nr:auxin response factor 2 [Oryza brachyantha]
MVGIDLNTVEEEEEEDEAEGGTGTPPAPAKAGGGVCLELWHACAGPVAPLPRKGSAVVYLPQGHLEHLGAAPGAAVAAVPPHVFCRVLDVSLHADAASDEVYAQVSLVVDNEEAKRRMREREHGAGCDGEGEDAVKRPARIPHMFCKTLTASDTSTHGGFSVPRRAAEDCFPPLDYSLQRPSQELVAKDLHGTEWRFRHIYRGQPRRHLLTTGWSGFITKKKLISGDAVLFLRGEDGELRLGVRRAAQLKNVTPFPALHNQISSTTSLSEVAHAVAVKNIFHIYYNPRLSQSEFIIPYWKFMRSFSQPFSVGMRFKLIYENEDASERRRTGIIIGSREADPMWHGSKWKCLVVKWDDDVECLRPNGVSPWEIELSGSASGSHLSTPHSKRLKPCFPQVNSDVLLPNGSVSSDFAESARFHKVLQGQELLGLKNHGGTVNTASQATEARNFQYTDERSCSINMSNNILGVPRLGVRTPSGNPGFSYHCLGSGESQRFQEVLQGQEVFRPYQGGILSDDCIRGSGFRQPDGNHASGAALKWLAPQGCGQHGITTPVLPQASSPSSVLMFPQTSSKMPGLEYIYGCLDRNENSRRFKVGPTQDIGRTDETLRLWPRRMSGKALDGCMGTEKLNSPVSGAEHESNNKCLNTNGCKIFGISLTEKTQAGNEVDCGNASYHSRFQSLNSQMPKSLGSSCATVHEQRPVVGRVVDISAVNTMI